MFSPDFKEFVKLLADHHAEYLIAGGYAVAIHGYPRHTGDLDIWINPTSENAAKVLHCLHTFGFSSFGLKTDDLTRDGNVIQLGYPPNRIDLLTTLDGVSFSDCYKHRKEVDIDGLKVNFIGFDDLLKNKKKTGRPRDMDDIANLK